MADAKPKSVAEIPNLPPERAVKRVGLNEWEIRIQPPMSGEALKVNLPKLDAVPVMAPQMPEPVMSSLLTPEPRPAVSAPLPAPRVEALPVPMTEVVAALLEPKALVPIVIAPAPADPIIAAPARSAPAPLPVPQPEIVAVEPQALAPVPQAVEVVTAPQPAEIVVASLPEPQAIEPTPQVIEPAPQVIEPPAPPVIEPAPQASEPAPAPQIPETVVASLLAPPPPNPVLASLAPPKPAEPTVSTPVPAPSLPGNVIAAPSAALTDMGPNLAWKASIPEGTLVRVSNGTGRGRMAARFAGYFGEHGLSVRRIANAGSFNYRLTTIFYNPDQRDLAHRLADLLPFPVELAEASKGHGQIELILGFDLLDFDDTLRRS